MSATEQCGTRNVGEAVGRLRDAFNAFFSSPCIYGMDRGEVVDHIASAIPAAQTQNQPSPPSDPDCYRRDVAEGIVDLVWQARLQDPLSVLPMDIGVHLMGFFHVSEVAVMREVSNEWLNVGNAYLATIRHYCMMMAADSKIWQCLMKFVTGRLKNLRSLEVEASASIENVLQDDSVLPACSRLTVLVLAVNEDAGWEFAPFVFQPLRSIVSAGAFRSLVVLSIELYVSDADAGVMAGHLPCLRVLFWAWRHADRGWPDVPPKCKLTQRGVAALINGAPSLTVLHMYWKARLTEPFPACRPGIRRLMLGYASITDAALRSLLTHIGADLRTLSLWSDDITNAFVECLPDCCPQLEALDLDCCPRITPACLPSLAQLTNLHDIVPPTTFADTDIDWLMQHTRSAALSDYRKRVEEYGGLAALRNALFSRKSTAQAEGVNILASGGAEVGQISP